MKTSENARFSGAFRRYQIETLARNRLITKTKFICSTELQPTKTNDLCKMNGSYFFFCWR